MNNQLNELRKPINVPVRRPLSSAYESHWHTSIMALLLVASIFMIVFSTFSSAYAFMLGQNITAFERPMGYAAIEKNNSRIGLSSKELPRETLPNIEETAFNNMILWKTADRVGRGLIETQAPIARKSTIAQSVKASRSMSKTERNITIGFLATLFAFMMWVTGIMWREFARNTSAKRKQY